MIRPCYRYLLSACIVFFAHSISSDQCLKAAANLSSAPCTANDLQTALITKFAGPPVCVNNTTIYVQLEANTTAGSSQRYDVGYFVNLDGTSANTGTLCYRDYLPPPLNTTPWTGSGNRQSPFWTDSTDNDQCGDPESSKTLIRNLGGTTVASSSLTPGPPAVIGITCKDLDNAGTTKTADISVCTSWDNNTTGVCNSVSDAKPGTGSKCNCMNVEVGGIIYLPLCRNNDDCNDNNSCTTDTCNSGVCSNVATTTPNTSCNDGNLCTTGDVCVADPNNSNKLTKCQGTAITCTGTDQCRTCDFATGLCTVPLPNSPATSCNDNNSCTISDVCTNGICEGSDACSGGTSCQSGMCVTPNTCTVVGDCNDNNPCTIDSCASSVCHHTAVTPGTSCNDGNPCTTADQCLGTVNPTCMGTPKACLASDQCHVAGTCDTNTGICSNPLATNGTTCDDGSFCTSFDVCTNGTCAGSPACTTSNQCQIASCDSNTGTCTTTNKSNGTSCNDGSVCTQTDTCQSGTCTGANPVTCTALDQCHVAGTCNALTGCSNPNKSDGSTCNDGSACTQTDTCQSGVCTGSNPVVCTALDQCHDIGTCNTATGLCSNPHKVDGTTCDDMSSCTSPDSCLNGNCIGIDTCMAGEICQGDTCISNGCMSNSDCDDNNQCTADTCSGGVCSNTPYTEGTPCDDQNLCSTNDTCGGPSFPYCSGNPVICTALDQCHDVGVCDPLNGLCSNPNLTNGTSCNDGIDCTGSDMCTSGMCSGIDNCPDGELCQSNMCVPAPNCMIDSDCNDNNACTMDSCVAGFCQNTAVMAGTVCDDGLLCTTNDVCGGAANPTCTGTPITCSALDQCHNTGTCDPMTGMCSNPDKPDNTPCDDSDPCTENDTCSSGVCMPGTEVLCNNPGLCQTGPGTCTNGFCEYPLAPSGTACGVDSACDGMGMCVSVDCLTDAQCPDRECLTKSCSIDNKCIYTAQPAN